MREMFHVKRFPTEPVRHLPLQIVTTRIVSPVEMNRMTYLGSVAKALGARLLGQGRNGGFWKRPLPKPNSLKTRDSLTL